MQRSGGNELSYTSATQSNREMFYLGRSSEKVLPYYPCPNPNTNTSPIFINNGAYISRIPTGMGAGSTNSSLSFYSAPWDGSGIIEVEGVSNLGLGDNALMINYFCGRNTKINVGWDLNQNSFKDGGTIFMGAKVDMQNSLKIGWSQSGNIDLNTSIEINQNTNNANGVKVQTWNAGIKAFSILRDDGKNTFIVYGDGSTQIGDEKVVGNHANAKLSVSGKVTCKSLYVLKPTTWQDKVFKEEYKLQSIFEVETYIKKYNHLPGIKSEKEILDKGYDVNEIDAVLLEKIENLYLYIIQQQKEINDLKNKMKNH